MSIERLHNEALFRANLRRMNLIILRELEAQQRAEALPVVFVRRPEEIDGEDLLARHTAKISVQHQT